MAIGSFNNPIVGQNGQLVINQITSTNYVPGVSGWAILKNGQSQFEGLEIIGGTVTIEGANGGLFVYSGTPALGNLIASIVAQAGTDPYGNAYFAVANFGNQQAAHFGVDSNGTLYIVNSANKTIIKIAPSDGAIFGYNSSGSGFGNLVYSLAPSPGTDPSGNAYLAGVTSYASASNYANLTSGQLEFHATAGQPAPAFVVSTTAGVITLSGGSASGGDTIAELLLESAVASGLGVRLAEIIAEQVMLNTNASVNIPASVSMPSYPFPFDPNTGPNWGSGERNYYNNLAADLNNLVAQLVNAGVITV